MYGSCGASTLVVQHEFNTRKFASVSNSREITPYDMAPLKRKTRDAEHTLRSRKKIKKQKEYHSSSEESDDEADEPQEDPQGAASDAEDDDVQDPASSESPSDDSDAQAEPRRKRDDPAAFALSISKILNAKLTTAKRDDPVLSRSKKASEAAKEISESRLEAKAKHKLREEKKAKLESGRVRDVLGLNSEEVSTENVMAREKGYKKLAQRGVVRMFNAIRAAQVLGEKAAKEAHATGVVGIDQRQKKVNEMSKKGFLDLIASGGKT
jgi:fusion and transport protein UGO1